MVEKLQKLEGENKSLIKVRNNMRAFINTSAPSLGEEGSKTIEDLKRQMVLLEKENIKPFNEKENIFQRGFLKSLKKSERFAGCVSNNN